MLRFYRQIYKAKNHKLPYKFNSFNKLVLIPKALKNLSYKRISFYFSNNNLFLTVQNNSSSLSKTFSVSSGMFNFKGRSKKSSKAIAVLLNAVKKDCMFFNGDKLIYIFSGQTRMKAKMLKQIYVFIKKVRWQLLLEKLFEAKSFNRKSKKLSFSFDFRRYMHLNFNVSNRKPFNGCRLTK